ncbi:MAG TPA: cysteine hydrolase family protein [Ilumatobacteraceae bacterium]|nr:cysteine hydrolase family protein [Ilumatobacteraceae bacterium]
MSALDDRPHSALLVIDMQKGVVTGSHDVEQVAANIATLVDKARAEGVPVVWVQHSDDGMQQGSPEWEYIDELVRAADEPVVHKRYGDSFEDTDLEALLADRGVGRLVVTGAQTDACIRSTLHGGFARGYDVTLVSDAHTTEDMREWGAPMGPGEAIAYTNLYWSFTNAPGRTAATIPTAEITFAD